MRFNYSIALSFLFCRKKDMLVLNMVAMGTQPHRHWRRRWGALWFLCLGYLFCLLIHTVVQCYFIFEQCARESWINLVCFIWHVCQCSYVLGFGSCWWAYCDHQWLLQEDQNFHWKWTSKDGNFGNSLKFFIFYIIECGACMRCFSGLLYHFGMAGRCAVVKICSMTSIIIWWKLPTMTLLITSANFGWFDNDLLDPFVYWPCAGHLIFR